MENPTFKTKDAALPAREPVNQAPGELSLKSGANLCRFMPLPAASRRDAQHDGLICVLFNA